MSQVYDILSGLGYKLRDEGKFYRTNALYRGGTNRSCMVVRKDNGSFVDFKTNLKGSLRKLVYLHCDGAEAEALLNDFDPNGFSYVAPEIEIPKPVIYDRSILKKLEARWELYLEDGVSEATMREFEVGYKEHDHLFKRYCFPIYNERGAIIGFAGRHETKEVPEEVAKWKLHGKKMDWLWPLHLNAMEIDEAGEVILVESPNDVFHLWDAGVKNVICMFGVEMSPKVFNYLIKIRPKRIIIATHNDAALNGGAGTTAAQKIENALWSFFSPERIIIKLPTRKDFGEMNTPEILTWKTQLYEQIPKRNPNTPIIKKHRRM